MALDSEVADIWGEFERETDAHLRMGQNHQLLFEQTITNLAALRMLNDSGIEEAVKNL